VISWTRTFGQHPAPTVRHGLRLLGMVVPAGFGPRPGDIELVLRGSTSELFVVVPRHTLSEDLAYTLRVELADVGVEPVIEPQAVVLNFDGPRTSRSGAGPVWTVPRLTRATSIAFRRIRKRSSPRSMTRSSRTMRTRREIYLQAILISRRMCHRPFREYDNHLRAWLTASMRTIRTTPNRRSSSPTPSPCSCRYRERGRDLAGPGQRGQP